jgi:hypothetical protein
MIKKGTGNFYFAFFPVNIPIKSLLTACSHGSIDVRLAVLPVPGFPFLLAGGEMGCTLTATTWGGHQVVLMRLAYAEPEEQTPAEEQQFFGSADKAVRRKDPKQKILRPERPRRYVWLLARLGGWKGYESKRHPGITALWTGLKHFKAAFKGWQIHRNVSTRWDAIRGGAFRVRQQDIFLG